MTLTINQEKQIRALRKTASVVPVVEPNPDGFRNHDVFRELLPHYEALVRHVVNYRRAQRLTDKEAIMVRKELLVEIDNTLKELGAI